MEFLIGGVQKGGTTALYEYLKRYLPVSLSETKEAHFFDDETVCWDAPDYQRYHDLFEPGDGRPRGEATPIYLYWPQSLERIAAYNPDMRLIFIFRDPVERAWSHWRMERARDYDSAPFSWAIRQGRERLASDLAAPGHHRVFSYVERGFYGAQLERALSLFPISQMLLLTSDDLKKDPAAVLTRVAAHLGVPAEIGALSPLEANVGVKHGAEPSIDPGDTEYLTRIYRDDLEHFSRLSGLRTDYWMRPNR